MTIAFYEHPFSSYVQKGSPLDLPSPGTQNSWAFPRRPASPRSVWELSGKHPLLARGGRPCARGLRMALASPSLAERASGLPIGLAPRSTYVLPDDRDRPCFA